MTLSPSDVEAFYDRFGRKLDTQAFYANPALDDLRAHALFGEVSNVFEFGCGTGQFAALLLSHDLPTDASYVGCDVSRTMVELAKKNLVDYRDRAQVIRTDGTVHFPIPDHSVGRIVATYVLDLLSEGDTESFFLEAYRKLNAGGKVCLVSLTEGVNRLSHLVTAIWTWVFNLKASLVGGCRPVSLERYLDPRLWTLEYRNVVVAFGVPSEILIATKRRKRVVRPNGSSTD